MHQKRNKAGYVEGTELEEGGGWGDEGGVSVEDEILQGIDLLGGGGGGALKPKGDAQGEGGGWKVLNLRVTRSTRKSASFLALIFSPISHFPFPVSLPHFPIHKAQR